MVMAKRKKNKHGFLKFLKFVMGFLLIPAQLKNFFPSYVNFNMVVSLMLIGSGILWAFFNKKVWE